MGFKTALCAVGLSALLAVSFSSQAKEEREHEFAATDITHLSISNGVGEIIVRASEADKIRVVVELEGQRRGILRRRADVSDVDISSQQRGKRLSLWTTLMRSGLYTHQRWNV
jgi:hypothetical protein